MKYFSMFTGVGGFELGIERASNNRGLLQEQTSKSLQGESKSKEGQIRFTCIGFSEIDKYANQLLTRKFPDVKNYGDATKINPRELPDFDMLCGGFPCQSFSIAGKRRGFKDTRGTMFFEIARILEVKRPKLVFLENVKGLLNHNKGETFKVILQTLEELGYEIQWMVLNSKFFGVPQNRERVFIIGSLRGEPRSEILPFRISSEEINQQSMEKQTASTIFASQYKIARGMNMISYLQKSDREIARIYNPEGISPALHLKTGGWQEPKISIVSSVALRNKNREMHQNKGLPYGTFPKEYQLEEQKEGISYTVKGATQEFMLKENMKIRRLTPIECERLQGFPDNYTEGFSDTQRYKMMGNAVTTNVIKAIAERLI